MKIIVIGKKKRKSNQNPVVSDTISLQPKKVPKKKREREEKIAIAVRSQGHDLLPHFYLSVKIMNWIM